MNRTRLDKNERRCSRPCIPNLKADVGREDELRIEIVFPIELSTVKPRFPEGADLLKKGE